MVRFGLNTAETATPMGIKKHQDEIPELLKRIDDDLKKLDNFDVSAWKEKSDEVVESLSKVASKLESLATYVGIAKTVGGSAQVLGGALSLIGLIGVPFTFGTSLTFTGVGIGLGVGGGLASVVSEAVEDVKTTSRLKKIDANLQSYRTNTIELQDILDQLLTTLQHLSILMNSTSRELMTNNIPDFDTDLTGMTSKVQNGDVRKILLKDFKTSFDVQRIEKAIKALCSSASFSAEFMKCQPIATSISIPPAGPSLMGISSRNRRVLAKGGGVVTKYVQAGRMLLKSGGVLAKSMRGGVIVLDIAFGVYDVYKGALSMKDGSQAAKKVREYQEELKNMKKIFVEVLDALGK